jgi:heme/copper-type cytochrome/quinol oxidase subunit 4
MQTQQQSRANRFVRSERRVSVNTRNATEGAYEAVNSVFLIMIGVVVILGAMLWLAAQQPHSVPEYFHRLWPLAAWVSGGTALVYLMLTILLVRVGSLRWRASLNLTLALAVITVGLICGSVATA